LRRFILTITCPDRPGIVAAVSTAICGCGGSIVQAAQHADFEVGLFFQRIEIEAETLVGGRESLLEALYSLGAEFEMVWQLSDTDTIKRIVLLGTREDHCVADILHRVRSGDMPAEVACIISNRTELAELAGWYGVAYHHVPVSGPDDTAAFARIAELYAESGGDVMVLARYMRVLPPELCDALFGQVINIHHSFLPSFAGAQPYRQAFERGVKLIGATCHYVTPELDAGPIIEQDTLRVDHGASVADLVRMGRDVERVVLARGLRWHLEDRVARCGNKTIIFD
jgi:formyltetrahydrofolate deformylase